MWFDKSNSDKFLEWKEKLHQEGGAILIDKEFGWTSFNVVAKLRNLFKLKKIGHAGTLDPLATGLLIICIGKYTKKLNDMILLSKAYSGEFRIGATTKSYDLESEVTDEKDISHISDLELENAAAKLRGFIQQVPPNFSAKKFKGKRAYDLARADHDFELEPVEVEISQFDIKEYNSPLVKFYADCSKGTYIRALARDFGDNLGVGAYLHSLRREKIGEFDVQNAFTIEEIISMNERSKDESL